MNEELICTWLGLPPGSWPPDHYVLLGLKPEEAETARIEQRVYERYVRLRPYQLSYPEQVTAAMMLLAQAFACLTDPRAKQAYDAGLSTQPAAADWRSQIPAARPALATPADNPPEATSLADEPPPTLSSLAAADPLAWLFGPWSQTIGGERPSPEGGQTQILDWQQSPLPPTRLPPAGAPAAATGQPVNGAPAAAEPAAPAVAPAPSPPAPQPMDPLLEAAQLLPQARRGLGTLGALYQRIVRTRKLLWAWEQVGKYLNRPNRRLTRALEAADLLGLFAMIRELLRDFPPILGSAGQAGYYVVSLAQQQLIIAIFRALAPRQREELARDWRHGRILLWFHRQFLREQLQSLRARSRLGRMVFATRTFVADQPPVRKILWAVLAFFLALAALLHLVALCIDLATHFWINNN